MEIKKLNWIIKKVVNLPLAYYNSNHSWSNLLKQTGYIDVDSELITIELIKKNINNNIETLDGWLYFSDNNKVENASFIWFNKQNNNFEIRRYDSKEKNYFTVKRNLNKEICCAYFIKYEIERAKQWYFEQIKLEKEIFFGLVKLHRNENVWRIRTEQRHHNFSYYPLAKLYVSLNKIVLKTIGDKMLITIDKSQIEGIFLIGCSVRFIFNGTNSTSFNSLTYYNIFKIKKLNKTLRKFKWY